MDPNETLKTMRAVAARLDRALAEGRTPDADDVRLLTETFVCLDTWLVNGAFLPAEWQTAFAEVRS